jgi:FlaA1/EpsC-like NDP-sugar epimerase
MLKKLGKKTLGSITTDRFMNTILGIRNRYFFVFDILAALVVPAVALTLRLDGLDWWPEVRNALALYTIVSLLLKMSLFYSLGLYRRYWRYANVNDLMVILVAVGLATTVLTAVVLRTQTTLTPYGLALPRSLPVLDGMVTLLVMAGSRLGVRGLYQWRRHKHRPIAGRRVLTVGAGEAGRLVAQEIWTNPELEMEPVAFVDDDPTKVGGWIQGLPVLGTCDQIPEVIDRYQIQRVIVAMPSAPLGRIQEIVAACQETGVSTYNLPGIYQLLAGYKSVSRTPQIDITRLLHRQPVSIDETEVAANLAGARVLVTGAGGSIGRELCRQIARFNPAELILVGHGENSIFEISLDLGLSHPDLTRHSVIADIRDPRRINWLIRHHQPDVIFHAAAHKHVPLMEGSISEAMTNNVLGTRNLLAAAERNGVGRFVLISTDKAVNPTSVMGATKRLAELLVVAAARRSGQSYMAVRFGNVLGSRGSVVPVFQQQIAAGGPVTVTHPEMCRYFMTIPEAVQLVLQAAVLGQGGEVFVLDMGQPVRIVDLANDLIRLSGLEPESDIKIVFSGLRPGEKLAEELFLRQEDCQRTKHPRIFVADCDNAVDAAMLERVVLELVRLAQKSKFYNGNETMRVLLTQTCRFLDDYESADRPVLPERAVASQQVPSAPSMAQNPVPEGELAPYTPPMCP